MTVETVLPSNTFCEDSQDSVFLSSDCMDMILNPVNYSLLKGYFFWLLYTELHAVVIVMFCLSNGRSYINIWRLASFYWWGLHELRQRVSQTILAWDVHELRYFPEGMSVVMKSHKLLLEYPNVCWLKLLVRMNLTWTLYFQCLFMSNWKIPTFCYSKS